MIGDKWRQDVHTRSARRAAGASAGRSDSPGGLRKELETLIARHAGVRLNGNVASHRTRELTASVLFAAFRTLGGLGFKLQNPRNLGVRHIEALVCHWHWQGRAVATMQNELSVLRKFSIWIGKKGMVRGLPDYLPEVPKAALQRKTGQIASSRGPKMALTSTRRLPRRTH